MLTINFPREL
jgi:hypothetical protein